MERHRRGRPFAGSFTNLCCCTSSLASAKVHSSSAEADARWEHSGTAEAHTSRAAASFTFPPAKQSGKWRRWQVGLSRHCTPLLIILLHGKRNPWKKSCFTLRDKPACLCGCDSPARWLLAPTRSLCQSQHEVEKGNVQDASGRGAKTVPLPRVVTLNLHSSLVGTFAASPSCRSLGAPPLQHGVQWESTPGCVGRPSFALKINLLYYISLLPSSP